MAKAASGRSGLRVVRSDGGASDSQQAASMIGGRVREVRRAKGWSLARLSTESGVPQSTLSKFETDNLSLPIDRLFCLADALGLPVTELFDPGASRTSDGAPGRRSITRAGGGREAETKVYSRRWLFAELIQKRMFPIIQKILARDMETFGPLFRHEGEEFTMVLEGSVRLITDIYEPLILNKMDGVYIDSRMGHAYLNAGEGEAIVLNVSMSIHQADE